MGGGIAAMASMLLRDTAGQKRASNRPCPGTSDASVSGKPAAAISAAEEGPMVISFATPSCVSLELARWCGAWVESIVHADDAVPRLSTVSLELLKEDMTGKAVLDYCCSLTHFGIFIR